MKYTKVFNNHIEYETFYDSADYIRPNMSVCKEELDIHYNKWIENKVKLIITEYTPNYAYLLFDETYIDYIKEMYVNGEKLDNVVSEYTFEDETVNEYPVIELYFYNEQVIPSYIFATADIQIIEFPNTVKRLENLVFSTLTTQLFNLFIKSIIVPDSVTTIGTNIFAYASNINIRVSTNLTTIPYRAFDHVLGITLNTEFAENVVHIENEAFSGFTPDTNSSVLTFNNIEDIGYRSFRLAGNRWTIYTFGLNLNSIGHEAFVGFIGSLIFESTTPPTAETDTFYVNSIIRIYVPAESVTLYLNATGFSTVADKIYEMPLSGVNSLEQ